MKCSTLLSVQIIIGALLLPSLWEGPGMGLFAQGVGISATGAAPNPKALFDIDAATMSPKGGLLIPRMITTERDAITAPIPESLLIYNTTTQCYEAYNATTLTWVAFGCIGCQLPGTFTATAASGITSTSFSANWTASTGATTYFLDVSTVSTFATFVTGYQNLNVGNVLTYPVNTNLTCATTYYYRVRANNACGTSANSNTITVITAACVCGSPFTDARDSKSYNTVLIGSQCWMSQNLAYLPSVIGPATGSTTVSYYYVYGYTGTDVPTAKATANYTTYGVLYNWTAFMNGSASCNGTAPPPDANVKCSPVVQGACPAGWHVPSHYEWTLLEKNVGSNPGAFLYDVTTVGWLGTDEGGNLKQTGTTLWSAPNTGATNSSGFTVFPGGYRGTGGSFYDVGGNGYWWSALESSATYAWLRILNYTEARVSRNTQDKADGLSCRCVKD